MVHTFNCFFRPNTNIFPENAWNAAVAKSPICHRSRVWAGYLGGFGQRGVVPLLLHKMSHKQETNSVILFGEPGQSRPKILTLLLEFVLCASSILLAQRLGLDALLVDDVLATLLAEVLA